MQSSNHHDKQKVTPNSGSQQNPELSEAWRTLLGLSDQPAQADGTNQVQGVSGDPWSNLVHAQGMQAVDLQKVHLHDLHPTTNNDDIEHALDLMQEADRPSKKSDEK
jgi:hypothetical protein